MAKEENLSLSKNLYKIQLYLIKVIPMVMAFMCLLNSILSYYDIDLIFLSYIGSTSLLSIAFLYLASYVFKFCRYHRMFIHYIAFNWGINLYDMYIGVPVDDRGMLSIYLIITGIFLFIILYLYVKNSKKSLRENNQRH